MRVHSLTGLVLLSLSSPRWADDPATGFETEDLPDGPTLVCHTLSNGDWVALGNSSIALFAEDGTLIRVLHQFPDLVYASSIAVDPTETFAVVARGDGNIFETHRVDLAGGPATFLSFYTGTSMVFEDQDHVLLAYTSGFTDWRIFRMNVSTGATTQKSEFFPSGAHFNFDLDAAGNLYVAHQVSGASDYAIYSYPPSVVQGPQRIVPADGVLVERGFEEIAELAVSPDGSTFYLGESDGLPRIERIGVWRPGSGPVRTLVDVSPPEFVFGFQRPSPTPPAEFLAFQPPSGGEIVYQTWSGSAPTYQRRALRPARPTCAMSGPGTTGVGPFDFTITGGPLGGFGVVFYGLASLYNPDEPALSYAVPLFFGLELTSLRRAPGIVALDASGNGLKAYVNPTGATGKWAVQAVLFDGAGGLVGSTSAAFL